MDLAVLIKLVGGLFALVVGVRQALRLPARPAGVSSSGSILRIRQEWDAEEDVWLHAPVVHFRDEHGTWHDFTTATSTTWAGHHPGEAVTVVHPPGRPELARLKSRAHDALWFVSAGLTAVFILVGLGLLGSAGYSLLSEG
jgi:hypothetical protein